VTSTITLSLADCPPHTLAGYILANIEGMFHAVQKISPKSPNDPHRIYVSKDGILPTWINVSADQRVEIQSGLGCSRFRTISPREIRDLAFLRDRTTIDGILFPQDPALAEEPDESDVGVAY
jgi:hypothetical protein